MATVLPLFTGTASGTGSAYEVLTGRSVAVAWFYAGGGGFGAMALQVSLDGTLWFPSGVTLNVNNVPSTLDIPVRFIRVVYDDQGGSRTGAMTVQALQSDED